MNEAAGICGLMVALAARLRDEEVLDLLADPEFRYKEQVKVCVRFRRDALGIPGSDAMIGESPKGGPS